MIELRSDTFTLPTARMREAMARAPVGDDGYGEDPTVARLEELAAHLVGKPAACFLPSGTMANLCAILAHAPRGTRVLLGDESDAYRCEAGGASVVGGVAYEPLPTAPDGTLALADVAGACACDPEDPQFAVPSLACLENTHNRCGGQVLPLPYLAAFHRLARRYGLGVHLDGARLFNAAVATGEPAARIAGHADSVQFCLSKGLCAPSGSMVAGPAGFVTAARRVRKLLGGGMRQVGVIAAAGIVALEEMVDRLADDHALAARLADGLADIPGLIVEPAAVRTNIVMFRVVDERFTWQRLIAEARANGLALSDSGRGRVRAVTHHGIDIDQIDKALAIIQGVLTR